MIVLVVGGIGVGKSSVMEIIASLGGNTIYADKINKELLEDKEYLTILSNTFERVFVNGILDKNKLRELIVADSDARLTLNEIAHPRIFKLISERTLDNVLNFVEIPLLSKCPKDFKYDKICAVTAPNEMRVKRVVERDNVSYEQAQNIINIQQEEDNVVDVADFIISNDGDYTKLLQQTEIMFKQCQKG